MPLTEIVAELYGLPPDEFTAARNAKAAADKSLSAEIKRLPKPSAAAAVINQLVRQRSKEIDEVLDLGASLREAQEDLDAAELRALSRQRSQLVAAVAAQGLELLGVSASAQREVEQTLAAAMADETVADAVRSGNLVRALSSDGVDPADLTDATAIPVSGQPRRAAPVKKKPGAEARKRAEQALDEAMEKAEAAAEELQDAKDRLADQQPEREELAEERESLQDQLNEVADRLKALDREADVLKREREKAEKADADAKAAVERAKLRLKQG